MSRDLFEGFQAREWLRVQCVDGDGRTIVIYGIYYGINKNDQALLFHDSHVYYIELDAVVSVSAV